MQQVTEASLHHEGEADGAAGADADLPDECDIALARLVIRVHCPMSWPEGVRCNNCQAPFPCVTNRWGYELLERSGWTEECILALDRRVGPWF